jgi:hypothetical protein
MGLQVIDYQDKLHGLWVILVDEETQLPGKFKARVACRHPHLAPPCERLYPDKEARRPMTRRLIVLPCWLSGLTGERAFGSTMEFLADFVQTGLGVLGIIRPLIDGQDVFHLRDELGRRLGNALGLYPPRLQFVFF